MDKKRVLIDPGHGGIDYGAVNQDQNIKECDINLAVALWTRRWLLQICPHDINPFMTRIHDETFSLSDRVLKARELQVDLFVSVHCNSFTTPEPQGYEIFYWHEEAKKFADEMLSWFHIGFQTHVDRGIKRENFYVIGQRKMDHSEPNGIKNSILVECEFLSNPVMAIWLNNSNTQRKLGITIGDAIRGTLLC